MGRKLLRKVALVAALGFAVAATNAEAAIKTKSFNANGGTNTVTFLYTGETTQAPVEITAAGSEEWITIKSVPAPLTLVSGKTRIKVVYQVTKRETSVPDEGTVTLKIGTAEPVVIENVKQAGVACKIRPTSNKTSFEFYGGQAVVAYTLPAGCTLEVKSDNWFDAEPAEGNTFSIQVPALEGNTRVGKVRLTAKDPSGNVDDKKIHTVQQKKRQGAGDVVISETPTVITTPEDAQKAAASIKVAGKTALGAAEGIVGIGSLVGEVTNPLGGVPLLQRSVADVAVSAAIKELGGQRASSLPITCIQGDAARTLTDSSFKVVYNKCRLFNDQTMQYEMRDGQVSGSGGEIEGGAIKGTVKVGAGPTKPYTVTTYEGDTNKVNETVSIAMTAAFDRLAFDLSGLSFTMTANGIADSAYTSEAGETKSFLDVKGLSLDVTSVSTTTTAVANGAMRASIFVNDALVAAEELLLKDLTVTLNEGAENATVSIDGTYAIDSYPENACVDGTFVVDTTTDLTYSQAGVSGGVVKINNATVTIAPDGTATAALDSGASLDVPDINAACAID